MRVHVIAVINRLEILLVRRGCIERNSQIFANMDGAAEPDKMAGANELRFSTHVAHDKRLANAAKSTRGAGARVNGVRTARFAIKLTETARFEFFKLKARPGMSGGDGKCTHLIRPTRNLSWCRASRECLA